MIWFSSDHHFFHKNIIRYSSRPFSGLDEMHYELKKRWNNLVQPDDTIYYLGDLAFTNGEQIRKLTSQLNGIKYLVPGNHDKANQLEAAGFKLLPYPYKLQVAEKQLLLCHYPYKSAEALDNHGHQDRRPADNGDWLIHGHVHTAWKVKGRQINVSVEQWDYAPVSLGQIMAIVNA